MDNEGDALRTSMVYAISPDPELTPLRRGMCLKSTSKKQHSKGDFYALVGNPSHLFFDTSGLRVLRNKWSFLCGNPPIFNTRQK